MLHDDFYHRMTFSEFQRRLYYFGVREDNNIRMSWEQTRTIVHTLAAVNGAKGKANEIMPLPWDKGAAKKRIKPLTGKEIDELKKAYKLV